MKTPTLNFACQNENSLSEIKHIWAQFHKGLLNIEESMLLNLDLSRPLVATTKVFHWADILDLSSSRDSRASSEDSLLITTVKNYLSGADTIGLVDY